MQQPKINFSALDSLPQRHTTLSTYSNNLLLRLVILPLLAVCYAYLFFQNTSVTLTVFMLGLLTYGYLVNRVVQSRNEVKLADLGLEGFAHDNNFDFLATNTHINERGSLFQLGYSKCETKIISGDLLGFPFKLSNYHYEDGTGKNHRTYDIRVMCLKLPHKLPHMVIDCLVEPGESGLYGRGGLASTLPITFSNSQKIDLEGDFYKYFTCYAPDKYAINLLTIVAPDAMDALMRMKILCDIEIIDEYIYFYWPEEDVTKVKYEQAFEVVEKIIKKIGDKLSSGSTLAYSGQQKIYTETSNNPIYLKEQSTTIWTIIVFTFLGGLIWVQILMTLGYIDPDAPVPLFVAIPVIVLISMLFIYIFWRQKQKSQLAKKLARRYHDS